MAPHLLSRRDFLKKTTGLSLSLLMQAIFGKLPVSAEELQKKSDSDTSLEETILNGLERNNDIYTLLFDWAYEGEEGENFDIIKQVIANFIGDNGEDIVVIPNYSLLSKQELPLNVVVDNEDFSNFYIVVAILAGSIANYLKINKGSTIYHKLRGVVKATTPLPFTDIYPQGARNSLIPEFPSTSALGITNVDHSYFPNAHNIYAVVHEILHIVFYEKFGQNIGHQTENQNLLHEDYSGYLWHDISSPKAIFFIKPKENKQYTLAFPGLHEWLAEIHAEVINKVTLDWDIFGVYILNAGQFTEININLVKRWAKMEYRNELVEFFNSLNTNFVGAAEILAKAIMLTYKFQSIAEVNQLFAKAFDTEPIPQRFNEGLLAHTKQKTDLMPISEAAKSGLIFMHIMGINAAYYLAPRSYQYLLVSYYLSDPANVVTSLNKPFNIYTTLGRKAYLPKKVDYFMDDPNFLLLLDKLNTTTLEYVLTIDSKDKLEKTICTLINLLLHGSREEFNALSTYKTALLDTLLYGYVYRETLYEIFGFLEKRGMVMQRDISIINVDQYSDEDYVVYKIIKLKTDLYRNYMLINSVNNYGINNLIDIIEKIMLEILHHKIKYVNEQIIDLDNLQIIQHDIDKPEILEMIKNFLRNPGLFNDFKSSLLLDYQNSQSIDQIIKTTVNSLVNCLKLSYNDSGVKQLLDLFSIIDQDLAKMPKS